MFRSSSPTGEFGRQQLGGSLGRRLVLLGAVPSGVSLIAASILFLAFETMTARRDVVDRGVLLAQIAAANSAPALMFEEVEAAREALAPLAADPAFEIACLYDTDGVSFARFPAESSATCPPWSEASAEVVDGHLTVFRPIELGAEVVGSIYLRADADSIAERFWGYAVISTAVLVASILFSVLLSVLLRRRITEPLDALIASSAAITSGDLRQSPPVGGDDEIRALAGAFAQMADGLRDLVSRVRTSSTSVGEMSRSLRAASGLMAAADVREVEALDQVHESALRMTTTAEDLNQQAESVSEAMNQASVEIESIDSSIAAVVDQMDMLSTTVDDTVSTIIELTASKDSIGESLERLRSTTRSTLASLESIEVGSREARRLAAETDTLSEEMFDASRLGKDSVERTVETMTEIHESFDEIQNIVGELAMSSSSIGEVVSVIRDFAEGSRMLALNANIIASRAGEHGQSFAVVASEVDHLANRAGKSVSEIERLVRLVQRGTEEVVASVSRGAARVERGVSQSREAGTALEEIQERAQQSNERVRSIAGQTDSQSEQISGARLQVDEVGQIVEEITLATDEQQKASQTLVNTSEQVRSLCETVKATTTEQRERSVRITTTVADVGSMMEQTVQATRAEIDDAETIRQALEVLRHKVTESQQANAEVNRIVESMADRAAELDQLIARFRL